MKAKAWLSDPSLGAQRFAITHLLRSGNVFADIEYDWFWAQAHVEPVSSQIALTHTLFKGRGNFRTRPVYWWRYFWSFVVSTCSTTACRSNILITLVAWILKFVCLWSFLSLAQLILFTRSFGTVSEEPWLVFLLCFIGCRHIFENDGIYICGKVSQSVEVRDVLIGPGVFQCPKNGIQMKMWSPPFKELGWNNISMAFCHSNVFGSINLKHGLVTERNLLRNLFVVARNGKNWYPISTPFLKKPCRTCDVLRSSIELKAVAFEFLTLGIHDERAFLPVKRG